MNSECLANSKYTVLDDAKVMIVLRKLPEPIRDFEEMHPIKVIFPCSLHYHHPSHPMMPFLVLNYYCCFELILHVRCELVFFWEWPSPTSSIEIKCFLTPGFLRS